MNMWYAAYAQFVVFRRVGDIVLCYFRVRDIGLTIPTAGSV